MAIYNKQVKFSKAQLLGHYAKRNSIFDFIYGIVRLIGIIIQNLYCVSSYLVLSWILLLPISWLRSDLYSRAENYLYNSLLFIVSSWSLAAGIVVVEAGEDYKQLIEENDEHERPEYESSIYNKRELDTRSAKRIDANGSIRQSKLNGLADGFYGGDEDLKQHKISHKTRSNSKQRLRDTTHSLPNGQTNGLVRGERNQMKDRTEVRPDYPGDQYDEQQENEQNPMTADSEILRNHNNNIVYDNKTILPKTLVQNHKYSSETNGYLNGISDGSKLTQTAHNNERTLSMLGDRLSSKSNQAKPRILLLCNHISTADVPLIMQSFSTVTNQSLLWVLDAQFKPTNFGVVCSSHGDFFVAKNSFAEGLLREQVLKHPDRNVLVLFPEGGFLRKRIEGSNRYAARNGLPFTKNVTHPRFGAFKDLIDPSVGVTHIVDATLMYDDIKNPLSILDIVFGTRKEPAILNYQVYKRSEINPTEEWLRNIWLEKDKLLTRFYEDRDSVYRQIGSTMRVAQLDWYKVLAVHLSYILVCYLVIFRLFSATFVTMLKAKELYYSYI